mmetsp:Transcript_14748/g.62272  ORF Transcript_14748/g.62272 Transcript_14748/m.62272 type:complete len:236 (-) Transcript_14748:62-769(-)
MPRSDREHADAPRGRQRRHQRGERRPRHPPAPQDLSALAHRTLLRRESRHVHGAPVRQAAPEAGAGLGAGHRPGGRVVRGGGSPEGHHRVREDDPDADCQQEGARRLAHGRRVYAGGGAVDDHEPHAGAGRRRRGAHVGVRHRRDRRDVPELRGDGPVADAGDAAHRALGGFRPSRAIGVCVGGRGRRADRRVRGQGALPREQLALGAHRQPGRPAGDPRAVVRAKEVSFANTTP